MNPADASRSAQKTAKRKLDGQDESECNTGTTTEEAGKRPRTIGPSLPSLPVEETASGNESDSDSSGDSDIGPSLPPGDNSHLRDVGSSHDVGKPADDYAIDRQAPLKQSAPISSQNQRDEWMLAPPDDSDWTSRVDPTKLRNRKFNTGRSTRGPHPSGNKTATPWTETPEQKMRRLENEVMGIQPPVPGVSKEPTSDKIMEKHLQSYNDKTQRKALYKEHQQSSKASEKQDDPSARPFDREKDIAGPRTITAAQRREIINKSSDYTSRFTKGKFL